MPAPKRPEERNDKMSRESLKAIGDNIEKVIVGKREIIDLILTAMVVQGHVLLEDVPGTGKTKLAKALARSVEGKFSRIQFTPDLLPSDVTGLNYYNHKKGEFCFKPGPVFCHVLLADEEIRQAAICCECGICEVYACPMGLNPRKINSLLKAKLAQAGIRYERTQEEYCADPGREYRKCPTKRVAARAGVLPYYGIQDFAYREFEPERVEIPLKMKGFPEEDQGFRCRTSQVP